MSQAPWVATMAASSSDSSAVRICPVGLFGLHTHTTLVRDVTAARSASRSMRHPDSSPSQTSVTFAPNPCATPWSCM